MAIEKKLIHFSKLSDFETQLNAGNILDYSIIFIQDAKKIWTHGQYYDCNGDNGTSDSPTFLRIGDFDDEAKANFIAVANGEKSADYYICASSIQGAETNGIVSSLDYSGPTGAPEIVDYTFYGTPMHGSKQYKLLKITTTLTVSTGVITTTYKDVLDAKQDTITDLENIREGASKGATSVQPDDISEFITVEDVATVATSGSYEDLTDKPVYITDFDVLSLYNLAQNIDEVGGIQFDKQAIINALAANKIVLVPYEISDNISCRGYATLVGYVEDLLYFKVITDIDEIVVETVPTQADIYGQEVTLREWYSKQDQLVSGTNIKTIDGQSILGEGDLTIEGGAKVYTWNWDGSESGTLTQEEYDGINEADVVYVNSMDSSTVSMVKAEYNDGHISLDMSTGIDLGGGEQGLVSVVIDILPDLTYFSKTGIYPITTHTSQLINDSNFVDSSNLKTINGQSLVGTGDIVIGDGTYILDWDGSESGTITQDQWDALQSSDNILVSYSGVIITPQMVTKAESLIVMSWIATNALTDWGLMNITISSDLSYQTFTQEATYIKSGGLKTINGESLEGSGDITISGGSSSGSSAYSEVSHGTGDTTFTLTPNTFHIWDEVSALTLTLGAETSGVANEYTFQFTSGSEPTTLSLPDDIKWTGGETPTIEANKIYQISILKGLGSVLEWDNAPTLIENKATLNSDNTITFQYPVASDVTVYIGSTISMAIQVQFSAGETTVTFRDMADPGSSILSISPAQDDTYNYIF